MDVTKGECIYPTLDKILDIPIYFFIGKKKLNRVGKTFTEIFIANSLIQDITAKMGKKRKAPASRSKDDRPEENFNKRVRLNLKSYEDVAGSDDEFHLGRDKIALEKTPAEKRLKDRREKEEFLDESDEEVLDYSNDDNEEDEEDDGDEEFSDQDNKSQSKQGVKQNGNLVDSEDDLQEEDEEDELNEWGDSKGDYYGADNLETEQDALDEEVEAKRLQTKQLQDMTAADYGFDENEWAAIEKKQEEDVKGKNIKNKQTVIEILPQQESIENMTNAERVKLLKQRFPEFRPLSKEYMTVEQELAVIQRLQKVTSKNKNTNHKNIHRDGPVSSLVTKERTAAAYLSVLAMYFLLFTSQSSTDLVIKDHPVMDEILRMKELWQKVKKLPDHDSEDDSDSSANEEGDESLTKVDGVVQKPFRKRSRKTRAQKTEAAAIRQAEEIQKARMEAAEADLADLDNLLVSRTSTKKVRPEKNKTRVSDDKNDGSESDIGEVELTDKQIAEKLARRKSLRFYTSQIAQKSNKRGQASRIAGGDDDIPHRERLRDRQDRLTAEATKRGQNDETTTLTNLDDDEHDSHDEHVRQSVNYNISDDEGEDYYQHISNVNDEKKTQRRELAAAKKDALLNNARVVEEETVGVDGKRKITYLIEKNKGLTPHRKKDVRNPRVKKRKKYEEKKKKLASMRPVYNAKGEGKGGYGGEMSGIKTNLVKSRKL